MSADQISLFLDFAGQTDKHIAEIFLENNGRDVERAVSAFFDNSDPGRYKNNQMVKWDDRQFSADRSGAKSQQDEMPAFGMDDESRDGRLRSLTAPSRPPSRNASRASQRTLRGSDVEMTELAPGNDAGYDPELQRALKMSMEGEVVPDADAQDRRRGPGEPAFLKPLTTKDFLPSLITILHTVPCCRYAFLAKQDLRLNYGTQDQISNWWSGESIELSSVRMLDQDGHGENNDPLELVYEMQRLMAFLDKTTRAYGSAAALSRLPAINDNHSDSFTSRFLKAWEKVSRALQSNENQPRSLFASETITEERREIEQYMLDVSPNALPTKGEETLYDAIDKTLWQDSTSSTKQGLRLDVVAPILLMQLPRRPAPYTAESRNNKLEIPSTFYADRYHISNTESMLNMQKQVEERRKSVQAVEQKLAKIETVHSTVLGKSVVADTLLKTSIGYFENSEANTLEETTGLMNADVVKRLRLIAEQLEKRAKALKEDLDKQKADSRKLSQLFTSPNAEEQPKMLYHLVGVAAIDTDRAETYIRASQPNNLVDVETEWWHLTYETQGRGSNALLTKQKVAANAVLNSAGSLYDDTLLVYAADRMLDTSGLDTELPDALKDFVNTDNAVFRDELADLEPAAPPQVITGIPADLPPTYDTVTEDLLMNIDGEAGSGPAVIDPTNVSFAGDERSMKENKQDGHVTVTESEDTEMTDVSL